MEEKQTSEQEKVQWVIKELKNLNLEKRVIYQKTSFFSNYDIYAKEAIVLKDPLKLSETPLLDAFTEKFKRKFWKADGTRNIELEVQCIVSRGDPYAGFGPVEPLLDTIYSSGAYSSTSGAKGLPRRNEHLKHQKGQVSAIFFFSASDPSSQKYLKMLNAVCAVLSSPLHDLRFAAVCVDASVTARLFDLKSTFNLLEFFFVNSNDLPSELAMEY